MALMADFRRPSRRPSRTVTMPAAFCPPGSVLLRASPRLLSTHQELPSATCARRQCWRCVASSGRGKEEVVAGGYEQEGSPEGVEAASVGGPGEESGEMLGGGDMLDFNEALAKGWGALEKAVESEDFATEEVVEEKSLRRIFIEENQGEPPPKKKRGRKKVKNQKSERQGGGDKEEEATEENKEGGEEDGGEDEKEGVEDVSERKLGKLGGRAMMISKKDIDKLKMEPVWDPEPKWFFVQTKSGCENSVAISLRNAANKMRSLKVYDIVVPTTKTMRLTKGGKAVKKDERMFPGYILIHMVMSKKSYNDIRGITNCQGFMGDPNMVRDKKQPIRPPLHASQAEVDAVFARLREAEERDPKEKFKLLPGDWVDVITGSFKNKRGRVINVKPDLGIVVTRLAVFGRKTAVELKYDQIASVDPAEVEGLTEEEILVGQEKDAPPQGVQAPPQGAKIPRGKKRNNNYGPERGRLSKKKMSWEASWMKPSDEQPMQDLPIDKELDDLGLDADEFAEADIDFGEEAPASKLDSSPDVLEKKASAVTKDSGPSIRENEGPSLKNDILDLFEE